MELALPSSASLQSRRIIRIPPLLRPQFSKPNLHLFRRNAKPSKFELFSAPASPVSADRVPVLQPESVTGENTDDKFDWYAQWYPLMPECDLDKRAPHAKKVLGIDVVVWWDKNKSAWKVFDDMCPHRLAPLSEGRIDGSGRLQCVYHGWCFDGSGSCKLIPQAPADGPPVHTNDERACVAAYPTVEQYGIVWFWPNSDPRYRDIFEKKKPPFVPELNDPSFAKLWTIRDFPYGYEVLIENLMDPAHAPYAHYGLLPTQPPKESMTELPSQLPGKTAFVFMCIPVSPGKSRLILSFPRNFDTWIDKLVPRWFVHLGLNLVLDSDLHLLHAEEQRIKANGGNANWHKACFVPTKSDALVVGFRRWLNQYGGGEVDWRGKYNVATDADDRLPPTLPRDQLMDRYWTHVTNCSSCKGAYKGFKALETILLVLSVGLIAAVAATKDGMVVASTKPRFAIMAMICFAASRWLARFVYTNFRYHDYNHALPPASPFSIIKRVGRPV